MPEKHPLIYFAKHPDKVESVLALDDTVIWGGLSLMGAAKDVLIAEFATRLRDRRLFKCIDVRARLSQVFGEGEEASSRTDKACAAIAEKITGWLSEKDDAAPRILTDEEIREPYKRFQESKGPLNQIRIKTVGGDLVDLGERSKVVAAIDPFRLFRVYLSDADDEARAFVEEAIKEAKDGTGP